MAAGDPIIDLSDLVNLATGGNGGAPEQVNFTKSGLQNGATLGSATVAGRLHSMWRWDGQPGAASQTAPTTAVVCTNATDGALKQASPSSGKRKRLLGAAAAGLVAGTLIIYDRLVQHGGFSGQTTTAQTTNLPSGTTPALTRYTSGVGVELWLEIYSVIGTTGTTVTCNYNDQANVASTSQAITFGGTGYREQDRLLPVALASGDTGVRAATNADLLASTVSVPGNFGITLAYPIVSLPMSLPGVGVLYSAFLLHGGPVDLGVNSDACLAFAWQANGTTAPTAFGSAYFMEK